MIERHLAAVSPDHQSRLGQGDKLTHLDLPFKERSRVQLHEVKDAWDDHVHVPVHPSRQRVDLSHHMVRRLLAKRLLDDRFGGPLLVLQL